MYTSGNVAEKCHDVEGGLGERSLEIARALGSIAVGLRRRLPAGLGVDPGSKLEHLPAQGSRRIGP